jgi:hypothetical protein
VNTRPSLRTSQQLGDQDGSIGLIALTGLDHLVRRDRKTATSGIVK